ncbi:hypothetical protein XENOCAPTIV_003717 [Xenoophorus captivus]|uniref:Uncharacterized protein n=1 Tax=Xenoophorus captivus TaxID=1517983 RepID=A0ABV0RQE8_9TELE
MRSPQPIDLHTFILIFRVSPETSLGKASYNGRSGFLFSCSQSVPLFGCFSGAGMVLSTSQQVALAFTAVLFTFVVLPRLFGVGGGTAAKETKFDPRYNRKDISRGRNLEELIESIGASQTSTAADTQPSPETVEAPEKVYEQPSDGKDEAAAEGEEMMELRPEKPVGEEEDVEAGEMNDKGEDNMEGLEPTELESASSCETNIEEICAEQPVSGLRRRNRPE